MWVRERERVRVKKGEIGREGWMDAGATQNT